MKKNTFFLNYFHQKSFLISKNWNNLFKILFLSENEHFQVRLDGPGSGAAAGLAWTGGCRRGIRSPNKGPLDDPLRAIVQHNQLQETTRPAYEY